MQTNDEETHKAHQIAYFEKNYKKSMQPRRSAYIDRHVDRIIEAGRLNKKDRIIDVGCGIGKYTLNLADRGYCVEGLDIAPGLLEQLKEHNKGKRPVPVYCADSVSPPEQLYGQFDVVIGFFALHHMFNLEQSLAGVSKLLKPQGRFVFIEPNPYNPLYYLQILFTPRMTWKADKGIVNMRPNLLFPLMKKAGFVNERVKRSGFFPPHIADLKGAVHVEQVLEKVLLWRFALPFQIFMAEKE